MLSLSTGFSNWLLCGLAARPVWVWEQVGGASSYSTAILGPLFSFCNFRGANVVYLKLSQGLLKLSTFWAGEGDSREFFPFAFLLGVFFSLPSKSLTWSFYSSAVLFVPYNAFFISVSVYFIFDWIFYVSLIHFYVSYLFVEVFTKFAYYSPKSTEHS